MAQVVFGSAPGVPNWGSLLQRASDGMEDDEQRHFDTLFVVDSYRAWYGGEPVAPTPLPSPSSPTHHTHPPTHTCVLPHADPHPAPLLFVVPAHTWPHCSTMQGAINAGTSKAASPNHHAIFCWPRVSKLAASV